MGALGFLANPAFWAGAAKAATVASAGLGIASAAGAFNKSSASVPTPGLPKPLEDPKKVKEEEQKRIRTGATRSTILTSAQGVMAPVNVQRKTLLGE